MNPPPRLPIIFYYHRSSIRFTLTLTCLLNLRPSTPPLSSIYSLFPLAPSLSLSCSPLLSLPSLSSRPSPSFFSPPPPLLSFLSPSPSPIARLLSLPFSSLPHPPFVSPFCHLHYTLPILILLPSHILPSSRGFCLALLSPILLSFPPFTSFFLAPSTRPLFRPPPLFLYPCRIFCPTSPFFLPSFLILSRLT